MDWPLRQIAMSIQMDGTYSYGLGRLGRPGMSKPFVRMRPEAAEAINEQVAEGLAAEHRLAFAEGQEDEKARADLAISFWEAENKALKDRLADLYAKVEALPRAAYNNEGSLILRADVLALLDGGK